MKTLRNSTMLVALTVAGLVGNANAAIIDNDTFLTDTETGLEWLDVTATAGLSYGYVSGLFGAGQEFDGWRYATGDEFNTLLSGWTGVSASGYGWTETTGTRPSVDGLLAMLGSTLDYSYSYSYGVTYDEDNGVAEGDALDEARGMLADTGIDSSGATVRYIAYIMDRETHDDFYKYEAKDGYAAYYETLGNDYFGSRDLGSFLVRSSAPSVTPPTSPTVPVSEPASLALLGLGLFGITLVRRNKK